MPNTPYTYKPGDDVVRLANEYQLTPQQIINANPGGYPFSTGQTINIPKPVTTQFGTVANPAMYNTGNSFASQVGASYNTLRNNPVPGYNPYGSPAVNPGYNPYGVPALSLNAPKPPPQYTPSNYNVNQRGRGYLGPGSPIPGQSGLTGAGAGYASTYLSDRAAYIQQQTADVQNALANQTPPDTMSQESAASLGIDPSQHGYVLENGVWRYNPEAAQAQQQAGAGGPTSPRDIAYTWNRDAKNRKSRFQTNLQWAINAWHRKRQIAKGERPSGKAIANANARAQQSNNVTGFGLVDFGASSG